LIQTDRADEDLIVEAPAMMRHGGTWVLFYSGNAWNSGRYFVNYATADVLCDPFVKHAGQLLNQHTLHDRYQNPDGQDVLHTHGQDVLVFHAFTSLTRRAMFVAVLEWHHGQHGRRSIDDRRVWLS
jgi:arabinan endo-1,5-alpha-L-arabinosidase